MYKEVVIIFFAICVALSTLVVNSQERVRLGTPITEADLEGFDLIAEPSGTGFPSGGGTARQGKEVYDINCAVCHGADGEGTSESVTSSANSVVVGVNNDPTGLTIIKTPIQGKVSDCMILCLHYSYNQLVEFMKFSNSPFKTISGL